MNRICITLLLKLFLFLSIGLFVDPILAQTCNNKIPVAPNSRYQDNDDGTVTDFHTGLMWQQCSVGLSGRDCITGTASNFKWKEALQVSEKLNSIGGFAGYTDWRLPNIKELASLTEDACYSPAINIALFPNIPRVRRLDYWSSSPYVYVSPYFYGSWEEYSGATWRINFYLGKVAPSGRYEYHFIRLVRSGK